MYPNRFYRSYPRNGAFAGTLSRSPRQMPVTNPANWESFKAANPAAAQWIEAKKATFDFAASMETAVKRYGDLTANQFAAVEKCMARDAERSAQRTSHAERAEAIVLEVQNIRDALAARGKSKIMLVGFQFSLAPMSGANPGALYIKHNGTYVGKVMAGSNVFQRGRDFDVSTTQLLVDACRDPAGTVRAFAEETARRLEEARLAGRPISLPCGCCGLTLTDPVSVQRGIGPICAGNWGF